MDDPDDLEDLIVSHVVTIEEAQTMLARLIDLAHAGETVFIASPDGVPLVQLTRIIEVKMQ